MYLRDHVVILRSDPFREHDRRLVMFGESHGLLEAVARGVDRKESKQAGHLLPMMEAEVMIAKGAAFDKLAVARATRSYRTLRTRLGSLAIAGSFLDLFERLQRPGIVDAGSYALLTDLLDITDRLPEEPTIERAKLLFATAAMKLLDRTGFAPQLTRCGLCYDGFGEEDVRQLPQDGTIVHEDCYRSVRTAQPNAMLIPHTVRTVARFLRDESLEKALLITGTSQSFAAVSSMVYRFVRQTPLTHEPHGMNTIAVMLG